MCRELPLHCFRSFVSTLALIVVVFSWFKIEEFLHELVISVKNWRVEQKYHSFLVNWPDWALCSQHMFKFNAVLSVHPCISFLFPRFLSFLGSTVPLSRPSDSLEFFHSLIPPHYACCISACCCWEHNSRRRSLLMRVLSDSDTHHLNRHMVGYGCQKRSDQSRRSQEYMVCCECHEILIVRCPSDREENLWSLCPELQGTDQVTLRISWSAQEGREHTRRSSMRLTNRGMRMAGEIGEVGSLFHKLRTQWVTRKVTGTRSWSSEQNENNRKENLLNRRDQITGIESVIRTKRINRLEREKQERENVETEEKTKWTDPCPASVTVHRPTVNEKERTIVGGTNCVISDANIDCTRLGDRSLLSWSKKGSSQSKFSIWMIWETLRDDNQIRIRDKKNISWWLKGIVRVPVNVR